MKQTLTETRFSGFFIWFSAKFSTASCDLGFLGVTEDAHLSRCIFFAKYLLKFDSYLDIEKSMYSINLVINFNKRTNYA